VRTARESVLATGVLLRCLIEHAGFRALFIEGTEETGLTLDRYLYTGGGRSAGARAVESAVLRAVDVEDVLRGLRSWNREHPDDPVSVVSVPNPVEADSFAGIEAALADTVLTWRAETGQRIVHWGGIAHLVAGDPRRLPPDHVGRSAGGVLRARLGSGYAVGTLTIGSGRAPFPVPDPRPDFLESAFEGIPAGHRGAVAATTAAHTRDRPGLRPRPRPELPGGGGAARRQPGRRRAPAPPRPDHAGDVRPGRQDRASSFSAGSMSRVVRSGAGLSSSAAITPTTAMDVESRKMWPVASP
jgi:hypothetical protein